MKYKVLQFTLILIVLLGVMSQIAYSQQPFSPTLPLCNEVRVNVGENCTMVTPVLNCSAFTYDILNLSGLEVVNDALLTELNESVYFFNFTLVTEKNDFVVRLCDGTTREVQVIPGGEAGVTSADLALIAVAILVMGIIFILYKASVELDERNWPMKMGLFYGALILGWGALNLALRMAIDNAQSAALQSDLETIYFGYTFISLLAFGYLIIVLIWYYFRNLSHKQENEEDRAW